MEQQKADLEKAPEQKMTEMTVEDWLDGEELPVTIWKNKYQHGDETFEQWLDRVSGGDSKVRQLIREQKFIFAGRILSNRGVTDRKITLSNCFTSGHKVITKAGLKNIEAVVIGDEVLSEDNQYHRVNAVMRRKYEGDLYKISSHGIYDDIICTPNHQFLTQNGWKRADRLETLPMRVVAADRLRVPKITHKISEYVVDLLDYTKYLSESRTYRLEGDKIQLITKMPIHDSRGNFLGRYHDGLQSHLVNRFIQFDEEFSYMVGRWLGDGSITKRKGKRNPSILQIVFNATTEKDAAERFIKDCEHYFGFVPSVRITKQNVIAVRVESELIALFFLHNFGEKCDGKYVDDRHLGNLQMAIGLLDADGCITTHGAIKIVLNNFRLMTWLRDTLYLNGINASPIKDISYRQLNSYEMNISTSFGKGKLTPLMSKSYFDKRHDNTNVLELDRDYIEVKNIEVLENQSVDVYNLSVDDVHSYTVNGVVVHNCYVTTPPTDSIESIFEAGTKIARTFSYGGGCGIDISNLRPKDSPVNNAAKSTSGAVSFMDFYSYITGLIGQAGRRGALMISMSCEHPDLVDFINLKSDLDVCTKANISLRVTDAFMKAVEQNSDFKLHFTMEDGSEITKVINAREVFMLLAQRNWEMAEPGILYWDRITNYNLLQDTDFQYVGLNPCGEEPLPAGGSCLLGSINLSEFVVDPYTDDAHVDYVGLMDAVEIAVRALNDVLMEGLPLHPLQEQRDSVRDWRQIGLGTLGLGDMLIKLGIKYGSPESLEQIDELYRNIAYKAIITSLNLASEKGAFPKCDGRIKRAIIHSDFIKSVDLSYSALAAIEEYGLYNSQLLTCAPTGTIGTMLQVSTGVEPNFAFSYNRRTVSLNNTETTYKVDAKIVREYKKTTGKNELPDYFVSSADIDYRDRIKVQAMLQKYIDASISSTVNLPNSATVEDVADLYMQAWKNGLKGITIWRDGCKRAGILTTGETKAEKKDDLQRGVIRKASDNLIGRKKTLNTGCGTLHLSAWFEKSTGELVETFFSKGSTGGCALFMTGLSRMTSLAARAGANIEAIVDQLQSSGTCPSYAVRKATKKDTSKGSSCPVAIGYALMDMYKELQQELKLNPQETVESAVITKDTPIESPKCPKCGEPIQMVEGCMTCPSCGYSKCS